MLIRTIALILCVYYSCLSEGRGQSTLLYSDSARLVSVSPFVSYYIDSTGRLSFSDIQRLPSTAFRSNDNSGMSYGNTNLVYWFRLSIQNQTQQPLLLVLKNQEVREADVYSISQDGSVKSWKTGLLRPFSGHFFQTNLPTMDLGKAPQEVYVRMNTPVMYAPMEVGTFQPIMNETHRVDLLFGIVIGLMLAMSVYNLAFFFFVKDRLYLYYAGYIFFSVYLIVHTKGLTHEFFFHDNPGLNGESNFGASLMVMFAWLFSTRFLNTRALSPLFHRWITFLAILGLAMLPTEFLPYQPWVNNVYQLVHLTSSVSLLFGGIHIYLLGYKPAKYYVLAFGFFLTGYGIVILAFAGILPANKFYTLYGYHIGATLEAFILSFAVANRINTYRTQARDAQAIALQRAQENEKLLAEQTQLLADKIRLEEQGKKPNLDVQDLLRLMQDERSKLHKLSVPTLEGVLLLPTQDIIRLEALGSYCTIYLSDNKKVVASRPVSYFEAQLDTADFFRVHKSHLINLRKVERYVRGEGGSVILLDGSEVGVSRSVKQELLDRLAIS